MRDVLVERAAAVAADVADHEPRGPGVGRVVGLHDREQHADELGAAVAPVAAIGHAIQGRIPRHPERALGRELHAVDQAPVVGQAERDRVSPDDLGHDRRAAAARGHVGCQRRQARERYGTERYRRERERSGRPAAHQHARDRHRREHERRGRGQEAPLEAALALVRPWPAVGAGRRRPGDDDRERLRLGRQAHDPGRRDLGATARGDANPLARDDRELFRPRVATAPCFDSSHLSILVRSRADAPGPVSPRGST